MDVLFNISGGGKGIISNILNYKFRKISVIWDTLIISFYGFRVAHVSKNTLMLYQQDLQLGPYCVKWQPTGNINGCQDSESHAENVFQ